jgi:acetyl-CoA C-acetyltransferase
MNVPVHIIGAYRTDFKRNLQKEGKALRDVIVEAANGAIADAGIAPSEVQAGIVGNFAGGLYTKQLHFGAYLAEADPALRGIPTFHAEAACASGGVAVLTAAKLIMGGIHDVVLVVGAEQQKTMAPSAGAEVLGAAGDFRAESAQYGEHMFPKLFGHVAELYAKRYALSDEDLARVAAKNRAHARLNPLAQMRDAPLRMAEACGESSTNPRIAPPLKISDCSQITDGAAALVLCSGPFFSRLGKKRATRLMGFGHTTDYLALEKKDIPEFSIASKAASQAYAMAGVKPTDLNGAEVHDCFSISEIIAYEILAFAGRGEGPALVASGATALSVVRSELGANGSSRAIPVNASGGLIGDGHPVGATGVRQVAEVYRQLTATAGRYQIEGARRMLTFNMGGSFTTSVVMIWES